MFWDVSWGDFLDLWGCGCSVLLVAFVLAVRGAIIGWDRAGKKRPSLRWEVTRLSGIVGGFLDEIWMRFARLHGSACFPSE